MKCKRCGWVSEGTQDTCVCISLFPLQPCLSCLAELSFVRAVTCMKRNNDNKSSSKTITHFLIFIILYRDKNKFNFVHSIYFLVLTTPCHSCTIKSPERVSDKKRQDEKQKSKQINKELEEDYRAVHSSCRLLCTSRDVTNPNVNIANRKRVNILLYTGHTMNDYNE